MSYAEFVHQANNALEEFFTEYNIEYKEGPQCEELYTKFKIKDCEFIIEDVWSYSSQKNQLYVQFSDKTKLYSLCRHLCDLENFDSFIAFMDDVKQILFDCGLLFDGYVLK